VPVTNDDLRLDLKPCLLMSLSLFFTSDGRSLHKIKAV